MTYRLVYADTGIPCSDWTDDAEHMLRYVADRPDFVPKIIVVDEKGNVVNPEPDGIRVSLTPDDMKMLDEGMASVAAQIEAAAAKGLVPVINASGRLILVPKEQAHEYDGNGDGRFDEFEAAADTADALEKLNADKPNDVRDDIFITKSEA